jgi:hypothetical protein
MRKNKSHNSLTDISAHNGKYSALIQLMPTRKACGNTLVIPVRGASYEIRIKHTDSGGQRLVGAEEVLRRSQAYFERFESLATRMAQRKVDRIMSLFEGEQAV